MAYINQIKWLVDEIELGFTSGEEPESLIEKIWELDNALRNLVTWISSNLSDVLTLSVNWFEDLSKVMSLYSDSNDWRRYVEKEIMNWIIWKSISVEDFIDRLILREIEKIDEKTVIDDILIKYGIKFEVLYSIKFKINRIGDSKSQWLKSDDSREKPCGFYNKLYIVLDILSCFLNLKSDIEIYILKKSDKYSVSNWFLIFIKKLNKTIYFVNNNQTGIYVFDEIINPEDIKWYTKQEFAEKHQASILIIDAKRDLQEWKKYARAVIESTDWWKWQVIELIKSLVKTPEEFLFSEQKVFKQIKPFWFWWVAVWWIFGLKLANPVSLVKERALLAREIYWTWIEKIEEILLPEDILKERIKSKLLLQYTPDDFMNMSREDFSKVRICSNSMIDFARLLWFSHDEIDHPESIWKQRAILAKEIYWEKNPRINSEFWSENVWKLYIKKIWTRDQLDSFIKWNNSFRILWKSVIYIANTVWGLGIRNPYSTKKCRDIFLDYVYLN